MAIILAPLPYAETDLEPHISAQTLKLHHGKHHAGYVEKTNALAAEAGLGEAALEEIIAESAKTKNRKLFNQAAQAWNHGFYWHSLSASPARPTAELAAAINAAFGSLAALEEKWIAAASDHFGSGWAWLVADGDALSIETTHDAATPLTGTAKPLAVIDVWEHAYYLDHQNQRKAYVEAAVHKLLNWNFASENFARDTVWTYPAS